VNPQLLRLFAAIPGARMAAKRHKKRKKQGRFRMAQERDISSGQDEIREFKEEKDKIRRLVGQIGGADALRHHKLINVLFIVSIVALFGIDLLLHILGIRTLLPPLFLIELGVLLVSVKIIWMIHSQTKVAHFQFWILNSIEFRLNDLSKRIRKMAKWQEAGMAST